MINLHSNNCTEECQSGWLEQSWKLSYLHGYRGFESHFLLHFNKKGQSSALSFFIIQSKVWWEPQNEVLFLVRAWGSWGRSVFGFCDAITITKTRRPVKRDRTRQSHFLLHLRSLERVAFLVGFRHINIYGNIHPISLLGTTWGLESFQIIFEILNFCLFF